MGWCFLGSAGVCLLDLCLQKKGLCNGGMRFTRWVSAGSQCLCGNMCSAVDIVPIATAPFAIVRPVHLIENISFATNLSHSRCSNRWSVVGMNYYAPTLWETLWES